MLKIKKNKNKIEITHQRRVPFFTLDFCKALLIAIFCHLSFMILFQVAAIAKEKERFLPFTKVIADPVILNQNTNIQDHKTFPTLDIPEHGLLKIPSFSFHFEASEPDFSKLEAIDYQIAENEDD